MHYFSSASSSLRGSDESDNENLSSASGRYKKQNTDRPWRDSDDEFTDDSYGFRKKCRDGDWQAALSGLDQLLSNKTSLPISCWNSVMYCLGDQKKWWMALNMLGRLRQVDDCRPNQATYCILITAAGKCKQWEKCTQLLEDMKDHLLQPTQIAYNALITAFDKCGGRWLDALRSLQEMRDNAVPRDNVVYSSTISSCAKAGNWVGALKLLEEMQSVDAIEPNTVTYSAAMTACGRGKQLEKTLALLKEMQYKTLKANVIAFNAAIDACKNAGRQWQRALEVLQDMRLNRVLPNVVTYSTAISSCAAKEESAHIGLHLFDEMPKKQIQPNTITYTSAIHCCSCKAEYWRRALQLLSQMIKKRINPNNVTYTAVINACGVGGYPEQAAKLLRQMWATGPRPDETIYNTAIQVITSADQSWQRAMSLVREMKDNMIQPNASTYGHLIEGFALALASNAEAEENKGLWERSLQVAAEAHENRLTLPCAPYSSIIKICVEADHPNEAFQLWQTVKKSTLRPDENLYTAALSACSQSDLPGVDEELTQLRRSIGKLKHSPPPPPSETTSTSHSGDDVMTFGSTDRSPPDSKQPSLEGSALDSRIASMESIPEPEAICPETSWEWALAVIMDLQAARVPMEKDVYMSAITACLQAEKASVAIEILRSAYDHNVQIDEARALVLKHEFAECEEVEARTSSEALIRDLQKSRTRSLKNSFLEYFRGRVTRTKAKRGRTQPVKNEGDKPRRKKQQIEILVVGIALLIGHLALEMMNIMPWSKG